MADVGMIKEINLAYLLGFGTIPFLLLALTSKRKATKIITRTILVLYILAGIAITYNPTSVNYTYETKDTFTPTKLEKMSGRGVKADGEVYLSVDYNISPGFYKKLQVTQNYLYLKVRLHGIDYIPTLRYTKEKVYKQ